MFWGPPMRQVLYEMKPGSAGGRGWLPVTMEAGQEMSLQIVPEWLR